MKRTKWPEEVVKRKQFLREASRVNRSPMRGKEKERMTTEISGRNIIALFINANQPMLLAKMFLGSSRWRMARYLTGYSLIWRIRVTKSKRILYQLAVSKRGTEERDSGLLDTCPNGLKPTHHVPTPTASDHIDRKSNSKEKQNFETNKSVSLKDWVKAFPMGLWATPTANEQAEITEERAKELGWKWNNSHWIKPNNVKANTSLTHQVKMFPTPQSRDFRTGEGHRWENPERSRNLNDKIATEGNGGQLNPTWETWLMGYPLNWLHGLKGDSVDMELTQEIEQYLELPKGFLTELAELKD